jgi:hypothetical protein
MAVFIVWNNELDICMHIVRVGEPSPIHLKPAQGLSCKLMENEQGQLSLGANDAHESTLIYIALL